MALTTVNITGTFNFPDATWSQYTKAEFHLSGYDTDTEVVVPKVVSVTLGAGGELDVDLWGNDDGLRGTVYRVNVVSYEGSAYNKEILRRDLGRIQISGDGPLDIADLLDIPVSVPGNWYSTITEAEYNEAIQAASDAVDAADNAEASAVEAALYDPTLRFNSFADFIADTRTFTDGTTLAIPSIGALYKATSGAGNLGETNAGGQEFDVLQSSDGSVPFIAYGPDLTGGVSVSVKMLNAIKAAVGYARSETGTSFAMQSSVDVDLPAGATFLLSSQVDVPVANLNYNIKCSGGRVTLKGAGSKGNKGLVFEALRNLTFQNINFLNFSTSTEWDTNNIDTSLIRYIDCEWTDCDLGVDTVSYAASRSTVLVFDRPRCGGVLQLVKSFCDMTVINDAHTRNADAAGALIFADSQLIVNGGIWTPYVAGASARWVDLDNSQSGALGSRSATFNHARFGPESSGGIPIAYSWLTGNTDGGTRTTLTHISMNECYAGSTNATTPQGLIVLMDNDAGTNTLAPNTISFNGGSLNASSGFVVTENGSPLLLDIGEFSINIDDAAQTRWGNETVVPSTPIVEAALAKYMPHWRYENFTNTSTGTITISVGFRKRIMLNSAAATTVTDLTDALEGHKVTLQFRNGNTTIQNGSTFQLAGGVDFVGGTWDTLDLVYDRAGARWVETGRSVK